MEENNAFNYESVTTVCLDTLTVKEHRWLMKPYLPEGKITMIFGDPGQGKTTFAVNIAASLSNGKALDGSTLCEPINIIYLTAEDGIADTILPRLISARANLSNIFTIDENSAPLTMDDKRLETAIYKHNARLVILDPIQAYLGRIDINKANDVRDKTKTLAYLGEKTGCTFILLGHLNKSISSKVAYRSLGSIDFYAIARSILLIGRDPNKKDIHVVCHIKSNLAKEGVPIAFKITETENDAGKFEYLGPYDIDPEDIINGNPEKKLSKLETAKALILQQLSESDIPAAEIFNLAGQINISARTIEEAKRALRIEAKRIGQHWVWTKPKDQTGGDYNGKKS